eukprot:gnl/TRDRNA2_/TRDRNA2_98215_c0_seq2.p1 gnl/TRDRNA2_/TRDRNA2_98215_c0~~gnl/TRDRNA2_/TRDRNA2_98215_c0_seq2.p1  ORF type:complete len:320 (-),score=52.00 gnl/TRDRNA2_/TRDRNA2_98215_c0_seq2:77-958(-)
MRGWRSSMEDSHIATVHRSGSGDFGLFAVLDGHGGWQVSATAKVLIPRLLGRRLREADCCAAKRPDLATVLAELVVELDEALLAGPLGIGWLLSPSWLHPFSSVGSTCCIAAVDPGSAKVIVANTGDSRAVLCRNGKAVSLSEDHKPECPEEKARIIRAGGQVSKMGPCCRIDRSLNLSRALGDYRFKANPRLPASQQKVVATPTLLVQEWKPRLEPKGDGEDEFLVVACDGIFERMTRQGVVDFVKERLKSGQQPDEALRSLLHSCCARHPAEPGTDNETAVLIQWRRMIPA